MTELGMALSNPYVGVRRPGHVGQPLPGVVIKRVNEVGEEITDPTAPGELAVKSPTMFREYWGNPESTHNAFVDGWFLTGDIAVIDGPATIPMTTGTSNYEGAFEVIPRLRHFRSEGGTQPTSLCDHVGSSA